MISSDVQGKNARILRMVVSLIWLVVFIFIILGVVFPLVYIGSLRNEALKSQEVILRISAKYVSDFMRQQSQIVAFSSKLPIMRVDYRPFVIPSEKGVPANEALPVRSFLQGVSEFSPAFRFFAVVTSDSAQPILLQPYQLQSALTEQQFEKGYAYREWVQKTKELYDGWDHRALLDPYVSNAFVSDPGNVPAISFSVPVIGSDGGFLSIFYANVSLSSLSDFVRSLRYGKSGKVYLVDSTGKLLAHPDMDCGVEQKNGEGQVSWQLRDVSGLPMVARALRGDFRAGVFRVDGPTDFRLASYTAIPDLGWILVVEQSASEAFSLVRTYVYVIVLLVLVTILVSFTTFLYISREIAEATRQHQQLVIISETDPLTGLLNRRSMLSRVQQFIDEATHSTHGFILAIFDIDDFKKVNDTYGHVFGDFVLREIAVRATNVLRADDLIFRWGGEEFLVIIRNCDLSRGRNVAEKIRCAVGDDPFSDGLVEVSVTVTIGVSQYRRGPIDNLVAEADEALYAGKRGGKNNVTVASGAFAQKL